MSNQDDPTGWMWIHACEVIVKAERLQRQFFQPSASRHSLAIWEPPVDVFEDEGEIVIVIAMPGVAAERVQVRHEPGTLVVRGVRPPALSGSRHRVRQLEIPYGAFERHIPLPPGRLEIGPPQLADGCLTLRLRRIDEASS
jgi:HSP20 family molecular chaperone IbpA